MTKIIASSQETEMDRVKTRILDGIKHIKEDIGGGKWPEKMQDAGHTEEQELYDEMRYFLCAQIESAFQYFSMQFVDREPRGKKAIGLNKNQKLATLEVYINPSQWDFQFKLVAEFDDTVSIVRSVLDHYKIETEGS